jgi:pimeloyl-ACP methyl ester carboxylesterase
MNTLSAIRTTNQIVGRVAPDFTARLARRLLMRPRVNPPRSFESNAFDGAERITFRFGLAGWRWGGPGPIVLALHGWQGRPSQFKHFVKPLLAAGRQVIALEAPAHGRSPGREAHALMFAESLLEAAGELRGIEAVIGHSMGGAAALIALDRQRFTDKAVIIGAPAAMERVLGRFADFIGLPAPARASFFDAVDRHVGIPASELDMAKVGPRLPVGGLIVHDRDDDMVPFSEGVALSQSWLRADFMATAGLGHRLVLADPAVIERAVQFIIGRPQ